MKFLAFLWSILLISSSYCATIKGHVFDSETHELLPGASIILEGTKFGAAADEKGAYFIRDVLPGKYKIRFSYIGYLNSNDSIEIDNIDTVITLDKNLSLGAPIIKNDSAVENYHKSLNYEFSKEIISITLDSLVNDSIYDINKQSNIRIYFTIKNNSERQLFIIRKGNLTPIVPVVKNSNGNEMKWYLPGDVFLNEFCPPDSNDLLILKPHSIYKQLSVNLPLFNFKNYPPDSYNISLKYFHEKPYKLPGENFNPKLNYDKAIYYYNVELRGKYMSANSLKFNNSPIRDH